MKPISVRFQNFGPYRKEMFVDFAELEKKGLFLICGETGAGKTTILDAMCYALYAKSSGGLRGDLSVMRCKLAEPSEETLVEFTFEAEGKVYRFTRSLRYGRKNLMDFHNCLVMKEGEFVPIFENPKLKNVNQKAEEIIGLNYEQFRQVIILPQGQFEKLLVSNSEEKEKILVSLFKAEKWQQIADEFYDRVAEEDKKLKIEITDIRSRLSDYKCETMEEMQEKLSSYERQLIEIEGRAVEAEKRVQTQKSIYENALVINEQFVELAKRQEKVVELEQKEPQMLMLEKHLAKADQAEVLRPVYEKFKEHELRYKETKLQMEDGEKRAKDSAEALRKIEEKSAAHEAQKPAYENAVKTTTILENAKGIYEVLEAREKAVKHALYKFTTKKTQYDVAKEVFEKAHRSWLNSMEVQTKAMETYQTAQSIYLEGISGTLAEHLEEGTPCPVCGSLTHPAPAVHSGKKVTEKDLDELQKQMQKANDVVAQLAKKRRLEEQKKDESFEEAKAAEQTYLTSKVAYEEAMQQKLKGIESISQLEERLADLKQKIEKYEVLAVCIQSGLNDAKVKMESAKEALEQKKEALEKSSTEMQEQEMRWKSVLSNSDFENEEEFSKSLIETSEKDQKKNQLFAFKSEYAMAKVACAEQQKRVEGVETPDVKFLKVQLDEALTLQKKAEKDKIIGQQYLEKMHQDAKTFAKRKEAHDVKRMEVDKNLEFANRLRGRSGISLQRYVLGVMLSSITAEANRLLKNVHKGRYQLYRTDNISGSARKGGLELEVLDTQSGERRSVTTLSGGEKFLVALGLAIGLSTVVQAQGKGMKLGAMFIDEGFGSLDENSIYDALEVLQGIQKANGIVGIISHVELLREVIPGKIEVHKSKEGSWF